MVKVFAAKTLNRRILEVREDGGKIILKIFRNSYDKAFDVPEAVAEIPTNTAADLIQAIRDSGK